MYKNVVFILLLYLNNFDINDALFQYILRKDLTIQNKWFSDKLSIMRAQITIKLKQLLNFILPVGIVSSEDALFQ